MTDDVSLTDLHTVPTRFWHRVGLGNLERAVDLRFRAGPACRS